MQSKLQDVMALWQNNAEFRSDFKKDPENALKKAHIELSPEDLKKIKEFAERRNSQSDSLDDRISK